MALRGGEDVPRFGDALHLDRASARHAGHDLLLGIATGIPDAHLEHEAVELRLRERIRPFLLDRVLRGQHEKRLAQKERLAAERHLLLLHRLEQRRLDLGRSAVDFVRQHEVGEQRALLRVELLRALIVDHGADHVRRQQIRRELDPSRTRSGATPPRCARPASWRGRGRPRAGRARRSADRSAGARP